MLSVGERAAFRGDNGRIITGKVHAILHGGVYLVIGDGCVSATYSDGMYRFRDRNIVR